VGLHRQLESRPSALVRHGSLRERRQVSPLLRTFATAAKRSTTPGRVKYWENHRPQSQQSRLDAELCLNRAFERANKVRC
jgi:hypothetical protein